MQTPNLREIDTNIGHLRGEKGQDGTSPTITVENITGRHRVTIVDVEHPQGQSFDILDGEKGDPGEVTEEELEAALSPYRAASDQDVIDDAQDARLDDLEQATTATTIGPAPIVTFDASAADMPLKGLVVNIEPVQAGTGDPSPDNVRPITGWTGCNIIQGQIPTDLDWTLNKTINASGIAVDNNDGAYSGFIPVQIGNDLLAFNSTEGVGRIVRIHGYTTDGQWVSQLTFKQYYVEDIPVGLFVIPFDVPDNGITQIRLSTGNIASFELLDVGKHIPITFPVEAGTVYGGTLDVVNKKLTVEGYGERIDTAEKISRITISDSVGSSVRAKYASAIPYPRLKNTSQKCSHAIYQSNRGNINSAENTARFQVYPYDSYIYFSLPGVTAIADYKDYFTQQIDAGTPITFYSELQNPIVYDLSDIPEITTILGTNNIWADTGDVTVTYGAYLETVKKHAEVAGDSILSAIAPLETTYTASRAYTVGSYLFVGTKFYKVISAIGSGDTINPGTNVTQTTVAAQLMELAGN